MSKKKKKQMASLTRRCQALEAEVAQIRKDSRLFCEACIQADARSAARLMVMGFTSDQRLIDMMEEHPDLFGLDFQKEMRRA